MSLASQLRKYRQAKKLTISELARQSNVSRSYITELESQADKQPSAEKLYRIAEVLDVTIEELLEKKPYSYEEAIRNLNKQIEGILQQASEPLQMLFQDIYKGKCDEEYKEILSKLVLIVQQDLPVAEMKHKGVEPFPLDDKQKHFIKLYVDGGHGTLSEGYLMTKLGIFEWKDAEKLIEQYKREESKDE